MHFKIGLIWHPSVHALYPWKTGIPMRLSFFYHWSLWASLSIMMSSLNFILHRDSLLIFFFLLTQHFKPLMTMRPLTNIMKWTIFKIIFTFIFNWDHNTSWGFPFFFFFKSKHCLDWTKLIYVEVKICISVLIQYCGLLAFSKSLNCTTKIFHNMCI